ncbi:MAG TPA: hypothetical protein VHE35_30425, partial [Kofleriaceae bacterium]|nr:hypothetical protein [Kofleriaceae bacterium]
MAACLDSGPPEGGPRHGTWQLDTTENWYCVRATTTCTPPAYFTPPPTQVEVRAGGVLDWGSVVQDGVVDGACIRVPGATEHDVAR